MHRAEFNWQLALTSRFTITFALGVAVLFTGASSRVAQERQPLTSTFFATAAEESFSTYQTVSDGDLWPSCWARDGHLYTANGDGNGFTFAGQRLDMAVSELTGLPPNLKGTTIATDVGTNWSGPNYNRKPTGMVCVDGSLYLAFQNLNLRHFSDAPAASIARSSDGGRTWIWNRSVPMFGGPAAAGTPLAYRFTTIFFLDYGRDSSWSPDSRYVYAYGLDNNWREQSSLFLARVPKSSIQERSSWLFFTGLDSEGNPTWSLDILQKKAVLEDNRLLYPKILKKEGCPANQAVVSQGGVVYDAPLKRYLFYSWSCGTHEFYEAPQPWGPWKRFLSPDFGPLRLAQTRGQYGTNIPSKFISADGKTLYVQSNVCCGGNSYTFALRKLYLEPFRASTPTNHPSDSLNLAVVGAGTRAISKSTHFGGLCGIGCADILHNGSVNENEDDYDGEVKNLSWWGYVWNCSYWLNKLVFETGAVDSKGGWFNGNLRIQARRNFEWSDVRGLTVTPRYDFDKTVRPYSVYTLRFDKVEADGVRIIGTPGGDAYYTSIAELAVYYDTGNLVSDGGFEFQLGPNLSGLWKGEGPDGKGTERFESHGRSGVNNAWLSSVGDHWNAITQTVSVQPRSDYVLTVWQRNNLANASGRLGVRGVSGGAVLAEDRFGPSQDGSSVTVAFNSAAASEIELYIGIHGDSKEKPAASGRCIAAQEVEHAFRLHLLPICGAVLCPECP